MRPVTVLSVVGARPNFMKAAALLAEMENHPGLRPRLIHTGQHHDDRMSGQRQFHRRRKDSDSPFGSGGRRIQNERRFRKVEFPGDRLHRLRRQLVGIEHHGQRISLQACRSKNINDVVTHIEMLVPKAAVE